MDSHHISKPKCLPCRVCKGKALFWFTKQIINNHMIAYYQCQECSHIQTEEPYWLKETYQNLNFQRDVGIVSRSIKTAQLSLALAWHLDMPPDEPCLDFGAGTGLLVRYCRDHGLNYYYDDLYSQNVFALGFEINCLKNPSGMRLVTAFEVFEHFPHPSKNIANILSYEPDYLLLSTALYKDQGIDWWYFLEDGQHVAVYTEKSLRMLGEQFGYHLCSDADYHLFSKEILPNRLIKKLRKNREAYAQRYKKRYGSKIDSDFRRFTNVGMSQRG